MWEFLGGVLEKGGVVAAIFVLVILAAGLAFRALWKQNQDLHAKVAESLDKVAAVQKDEADKREALLKDHAAEVARLQTRNDEIQERRLAEAQSMIREMSDHVARSRVAVERVGDTMDVIKDILTGHRT